MALASRVHLGYWNVRGLGQPIRMLLEYLKVPYEETRYELVKGADGNWNASQWASVKYTLGFDFPNLPYIIDNDTKISQSSAILRHICRQHAPEMLGKTLKDQAVIDQLMAIIFDHRSLLARLSYESSPRTITEDIEKFMQTTYKSALRCYSDFMKDKPFLMGDAVTAPDFPFYELLHVCRLMHPSIYDAPEKEMFKKYLDRFAQLKNVKEYIASDKCIQKQVSGKTAAWQGPTAPDAPLG